MDKEYENYILDEINAKKIILDKDTGSLFNLKVKLIQKNGTEVGQKN